MAVSLTAPDHPVLACAAEIRAALDRVAEVDPCALSTRDKGSALIQLARCGNQLRGLMLRVLADADDVALDHGARSASEWLAHETRADIGPSLAAGRLAEALDARWSSLREALSDGRVTEAQAHVIARALDDLPDGLDPEVLEKAEAQLISDAAHFEPRRLRILGRKVLDVVAPEVADAHEQRLLEDEEALARRTTSLTMRRRGDGTTDVHLRISDAAAGRLLTYLEAYAAPRRRGAAADPKTTTPAGRVAYSTVLGHAFCSLLEAIPSGRLPRHGGSATSVVVTIDHDTLLSKLGAAGVSSGEPISAAEAVRLACNASILPLVLDGQGQPLHLGRSRRLFTTAQRTAMGVRDGSCRADGCSIPAAWCEAHHRKPWAEGGRTDLADGMLLCSWHHHRAHDPAYRTDLLPNGDLRFHRRR
jgi:hypothetical protein